MDTNNAIFKGQTYKVADPNAPAAVPATGVSALGEQDYSKLQDKILGEIHDPSTYIDPSDPNKFLSDIVNKTMTASAYNPVSGTAGALGKMSMSPEVLTQMKGGDLIPGVAPKTISAIGTMAKSFQEGYDNARGAKVNPTELALLSKMKNGSAGNTEKDKLEMIKLKQSITDPIVTKYEANADIKDETTRAQAIMALEKIASDPNALNNREAEGTLRKLMAVIVRPEVKRMTGLESSDVGSIAGIISAVTGKGITHAEEVANEIAKGKGVLDADTILEFKNIADNFKELSKQNYSNAVTPYKNQLLKTGIITDTELPDYLRSPEGYSLTYVKPEKEIPVTAVPSPMDKTNNNTKQDVPKFIKLGTVKKNSHGDEFIYTKDGWQPNIK